LVVADELALKGLLHLCESEIRNHLAIDNVISIAQMAEQHNAQALLEECINVIIASDTLNNTKEFEEMSCDLKQKLEVRKRDYERNFYFNHNVIIKLYN